VDENSTNTVDDERHRELLQAVYHQERKGTGTYSLTSPEKLQRLIAKHLTPSFVKNMIQQKPEYEKYYADIIDTWRKETGQDLQIVKTEEPSRVVPFHKI
jgi:hypothetical protein